MNIALITPRTDTLPVQDLPIFRDEIGYSLKPFDETIISFFDHFSKAILSNKEINAIPEIVSLAFWLRRANIMKMQDENRHLQINELYKISPRGIVFHICPANVDTMFIYSMAVSILMANKNILRVSSRMNAPQISFLFELLNKTVKQFPVLASYINIIKYDHNDEISNFISERAAVRVIWGGDQTIEKIKTINSSSRTKDIVFPDRISVLCVGSEEFNSLSDDDENKFAKKFFNDAYTFDQKGCSSPQSIFIIGEEKNNAVCMLKMQSLLSGFIEKNYVTDIASIASLKLNYIVDEAVKSNAFSIKGNNFATFIMRPAGASLLEHTCGGGTFNVYSIKDAGELKEYVVPKLQTVSYFGLSAAGIHQLQELSNGEGIDRIVPIGTALDFYYLWDGYNLFDELSKKVYIK
jgi:hypothetical protein